MADDDPCEEHQPSITRTMARPGWECARCFTCARLVYRPVDEPDAPWRTWPETHNLTRPPRRSRDDPWNR